MAPPMKQCVEWAVASRPISGESGDGFVVAPSDKGTLVAVVDGLGHGPHAAAATRRTVELLEQRASEDIPAIVRRCHEHLRGTRGLVMSLAAFDKHHDIMRWLGIGNVSGTLIEGHTDGGSETLLLRGGVVGDTLPPSRVIERPVRAGDILILATDGVREEFPETLNLRQPLQRTADAILAAGNTGIDDALVLVARYRGLTT
jgi:hypothetical protein